MSVRDGVARAELAWRLQALVEWAASVAVPLEIVNQGAGFEILVRDAVDAARRDASGLVREVSLRFRIRSGLNSGLSGELVARVGQKWGGLGGEWPGAVIPSQLGILVLNL